MVLTGNIANLSQSVAAADAASRDVLNAVGLLARHAEHLSEEIERLVKGVRVA